VEEFGVNNTTELAVLVGTKFSI